MFINKMSEYNIQISIKTRTINSNLIIPSAVDIYAGVNLTLWLSLYILFCNGWTVTWGCVFGPEYKEFSILYILCYFLNSITLKPFIVLK